MVGAGVGMWLLFGTAAAAIAVGVLVVVFAVLGARPRLDDSVALTR